MLDIFQPKFSMKVLTLQHVRLMDKGSHRMFCSQICLIGVICR
jgi:hypothetical protein